MHFIRKVSIIDNFVTPSPETDYESLWVAGSRATFIATGKDTDGRYTLAEIYVPPQAGVALHIHTREDEIPIHYL